MGQQFVVQLPNRPGELARLAKALCARGVNIVQISQITAGGTAGNPAADFIVKGKDGLTYEYGNTADSRIMYGATAGVWLLNKVSDRFGNNYIVTYTTGAAGSSAS